MKNRVTVTINTRNEERNIKDCIDSALILSENIVVVDMESTDQTKDIAKKMRVSVYDFPFSHYVEPARSFAIEKSVTDWVFILDADERITEDLANEINKLLTTGGPLPAYFKIPRKNIFGLENWLKHGGWWPDYQTRLINKKYFKNWPKRIHSTPVIKGKSGFIKNPIIHYFHGDLESMVRKTVTFENIESDLLYKAGRSSGNSILFRKYFAELYRRLFGRLGILDGTVGVIESIYQAFSKTITYLFLYEKKS